MDILIDSNIIIDWFQQRSKFYPNALKIMEACIFGKENGYVTAHSLCDIYYILRKDYSVEERLDLVKLISERCNVISENHYDFYSVTSNPQTTDLEDGLQMICAEKYHLDYIITRNVKDFTHSHVPAILPQDFLEIIEKT